MALDFDHQSPASIDLADCAVHVPAFCRPQFSDARSCLWVAVEARAVHAGYGEFAAGVLAIVATVGLVHTPSWEIAAVWIFNVWGPPALLYAFYQGARVDLKPGSLGAGFYIATAIVPPLLVSHALIFAILLKVH